MLLTICTSFYNAEHYIEKFISQLKRQTCADFNCILIDDCSTDLSYAKCMNCVGDDKRFTVIKNSINKGVGAGRVDAINNCETDYLTFMDIDDEIKSDAVENYNADIKKLAADLIIYDFYNKQGEDKIDLVTDNTKSVQELFTTSSPLISHLWHKVFKTSLFNSFNTDFCSTVSFAEDLWLCINCFMKAQNPVIVHNAYYFYRYNSDSLVHKRSEKSIIENIEVLKDLLANPELKQNPEIEFYIKDDSFHAFGHLIFPSKKNDFQKKPHFKEWQKIDTEKSIFIPPYVSTMIKLYIFFIKKNMLLLAKCCWYVLYLKCS